MSEHAPCVICHGPVEPVAGEFPHYFAARTTCSQPCRNQLRSRSHKARAASRLAAAVAAWTPGASVTKLAQHGGIKGETLRAALLERGCDLTRARRGRPAGSPSRPRRQRGEPPRDHLLEALVRCFGPRPRLVAADRKAA